MLDGFLAGLINSGNLGSWQDVFLGGTLAVSWIALALVLRMLWVTKLKVANIDHRCRELSHDLQIAGNAAVGMGQRIIQLEKRLAQPSSLSDFQKDLAAQKTQTFSGSNHPVVPEPGSMSVANPQIVSPQTTSPQGTNPQGTTGSDRDIASSTNTLSGNKTAQHTSEQYASQIGSTAAEKLKVLQDGMAKTTDAFYQSASTNASKRPVAAPSNIAREKGAYNRNKMQLEKRNTSTGGSPGNAYTEPNKIESVVSPFDQAKRLLAQGLSESDVAKRCGLSKAEAALLAMVQRQAGKPNAVSVS
ncbi:DUF2802 domain-containing protein [Aurantivibrio plasticivorans]